MERHTGGQRLAAEFLGSAFLLATVIGSGIMGERLAGGNVAMALLGNTIATGAILFVLVTALGPISGAHFNPAVTAVLAARKELSPAEACSFIVVQVLGAVMGVLAAHLMFEESLLQISTKLRAGPAQWFSEWVAAFGLVATILLTLAANRAAVAASVGLYITAAYWFTASTSFANPAVTLARSATDTFAGIRPADAPAFIVAQVVGAGCATGLFRWLVPALPAYADAVVMRSPDDDDGITDGGPASDVSTPTRLRG
jgi:glycerol uptake facilitator-like aquaporin